jgi:hypothetical protein
MLALGLTTVILLAISMAIHVNLRSFDSRRKNLEESQLARTILRIIADDIRSCVQEYEQDLSGIEQMLQQSIAGDISEAVGGGDLSAITSAASGSGLEEETSELDMGSEEETSENTQELATAVTLPSTPGIFGNQFQLQLDVSRLPRFDEYQKMMTPDLMTGVADIPSDVKTVTYYVIDQASAAEPNPNSLSMDLASLTDPNVVGRGLVRRNLDRAVTQHALENGMITAAESAGEVIATEVVSIEFQYFDGAEWRLEWDTELEGQLPVAIEILLFMQPPTSPGPPDLLTEANESDAADLTYYRLLVPVATGEAAAETTTSTEGI